MKHQVLFSFKDESKKKVPSVAILPGFLRVNEIQGKSLYMNQEI